MAYGQSNLAPWEGTASPFYYRRKDRREAARMETFEQVFSRNNMFGCLMQIREHGGRAAGPDGVSAQTLTASELGDYAQVISRVILRGEYTSSEARLVRIPKPDQPGEYRTLSVPIVGDKAIAMALHRVFGPRFEKLFLPNSHGFRRGRSPRTVLRDLHPMLQDGRSFLALDDVEKAFDSVRIDQVMDSVRWAMEQTGFPVDECQRSRFCTVIRQLLAMGNSKRTTGIGQGNPLSPLLLNVHLHHRLDIRLASEFGGGYIRFADNLISASKNNHRPHQFLDACEALLHAIGLKLKKHQPRIVNLDDSKASVLGFELSRTDGRLVVGLGLRPFADLRDGLRQAHFHGHPASKALQVLRGWVEAWGPGLDLSDEDHLLSRILSETQGAKVFLPDHLMRHTLELIRASHQRWTSMAK